MKCNLFEIDPSAQTSGMIKACAGCCQDYMPGLDGAVGDAACKRPRQGITLKHNAQTETGGPSSYVHPLSRLSDDSMRRPPSGSCCMLGASRRAYM